jgi:excisionase family DNA binding protein
MSSIIVTSPDELRAIVSQAVADLLPKGSKPQDLPDNITLETAVELLRESGFPTSKAKIYKLTSSGSLPHRKYGNKLVFSRKELLQWAEAQARRISDTGSSALHIARSARRKR